MSRKLAFLVAMLNVAGVSAIAAPYRQPSKPAAVASKPAVVASKPVIASKPVVTSKPVVASKPALVGGKQLTTYKPVNSSVPTSSVAIAQSNKDPRNSPLVNWNIGCSQSGCKQSYTPTGAFKAATTTYDSKTGKIVQMANYVNQHTGQILPINHNTSTKTIGSTQYVCTTPLYPGSPSCRSFSKK